MEIQIVLKFAPLSSATVNFLYVFLNTYLEVALLGCRVNAFSR